VHGVDRVDIDGVTHKLTEKEATRYMNI